MSSRNPNPLSSKVRKWLEKQGYSLEMRVAQAFERAGFDVSQSSYYLDPESHSLREIDVVASTRCRIGSMWISVALFVECKYAHKPWVVFTSQSNLESWAFFSRVLDREFSLYQWKMQKTLQGRLLASILSSMSGRDASKLGSFRLPINVGYRLTESLRDSSAKDSAYSALRQVSSCVRAHDEKMEIEFAGTIDEYEEEFSGSQGDKLSIFCEIGIPVLVIRGKLFECYLNSSEEIALLETEDSVVLTSSKTSLDESRPESSTSVIRILTEDSLMGFAQDAFHTAKVLFSYEDEVIRVWKYELNKLSQQSSSEGIPF